MKRGAAAAAVAATVLLLALAVPPPIQAVWTQSFWETFDDGFDSGTTTNWHEFANLRGEFADCNGIVGGSNKASFQGAGARYAVTRAIDVRAADRVSFELHIAAKWLMELSPLARMYSHSPSGWVGSAFEFRAAAGDLLNVTQSTRPANMLTDCGTWAGGACTTEQHFDWATRPYEESPEYWKHPFPDYGQPSCSGLCNHTVPTSGFTQLDDCPWFATDLSEYVELQYAATPAGPWTLLQRYDPFLHRTHKVRYERLPDAARALGTIHLRWIQPAPVTANSAAWQLDNVRVFRDLRTGTTEASGKTPVLRDSFEDHDDPDDAGAPAIDSQALLDHASRVFKTGAGEHGGASVIYINPVTHQGGTCGAQKMGLSEDEAHTLGHLDESAWENLHGANAVCLGAHGWRRSTDPDYSPAQRKLAGPQAWLEFASSVDARHNPVFSWKMWNRGAGRDEDLHWQYSTDNGATWHTFHTWIVDRKGVMPTSTFNFNATETECEQSARPGYQDILRTCNVLGMHYGDYERESGGSTDRHWQDTAGDEWVLPLGHNAPMGQCYAFGNSVQFEHPAGPTFPFNGIMMNEPCRHYLGMQDSFGEQLVLPPEARFASTRLRLLFNYAPGGPTDPANPEHFTPNILLDDVHVYEYPLSTGFAEFALASEPELAFVPVANAGPFVGSEDEPQTGSFSFQGTGQVSSPVVRLNSTLLADLYSGAGTAAWPGFAVELLLRVFEDTTPSFGVGRQWAHVASQAYQNTSTPAWRLDLTAGATQLEFSVFGAGASVATYTHPTVLAGNQWYHVSFVYDAAQSSVRFVVDEAVMLNATSVVPVDAALDALVLGDDSADWYGFLDEVRVWRTLPDASQLLGAMREALWPPATNRLAAYLRFNEPHDDTWTVMETSAVVYDAAVPGNTGTVTWPVPERAPRAPQHTNATHDDDLDEGLVGTHVPYVVSSYSTPLSDFNTTALNAASKQLVRVPVGNCTHPLLSRDEIVVEILNPLPSTGDLYYPDQQDENLRGALITDTNQVPVKGLRFVYYTFDSDITRDCVDCISVVHSCTADGDDVRLLSQSITLVASAGDTDPGDVLPFTLTTIFIMFGAVLVLGLLAGALLRPRQVLADIEPDLEPPEFTCETVYGATGYLTSSNRKLARRLEALDDLLFKHELAFARVLLSCAKVTEADEVTKALIVLFENRGRSMRLLKLAISEEVANSRSPETLFRANSVASKMMKVYSKMTGLEYMFETLYPLMRVLTEADTNLEIDPTKIDVEDDVNANKWGLLSTTQRLFMAIIRSVDAAPLSFRHLCNHLYTTVEARFSGEAPHAKHVAVGGFVFLRFFCPAITQPDAYGLAADLPDPDVRRLLVLVAKTLQNLANGVEFGAKEQYMAMMNDFITTNLTRIREFFESMATVPRDAPDILPQVILPKDLYEIALTRLHRHVFRAKNNIELALTELPDRKISEVIRHELKQILMDAPPPGDLPPVRRNSVSSPRRNSQSRPRRRSTSVGRANSRSHLGGGGGGRRNSTSGPRSPRANSQSRAGSKQASLVMGVKK